MEVSLLTDWENIKLINKNRLASALLLVAGPIICLLALSGYSGKLCLTEGCQIYRGFKLWGISLHHVGGAAFVLGLYWLYRKAPMYSVYIRLCLWAETALLAFQTLYLPCSECLIIGLIWGLLGMLTFPRQRVTKIWAVLFLVAMTLLAKDLIKPWPVYGGQDSEVKVFFSPSCKHCRETILDLLAGGHQGDNVAFFPVALDGEDAGRVAKFQQVLNQTGDYQGTFPAGLRVNHLWQAFQACWSSSAPCSLGLTAWLKLHLGLLRNKLILARMGAKEVPLVLSKAIAFGGTGGGCSFAGTLSDCTN